MRPNNQSLRNFDDETRRLVQQLVDLGWKGRVGKRGHWIGSSPSGQTVCIPPKAQKEGRSWLNTQAQVRRALASD